MYILTKSLHVVFLFLVIKWRQTTNNKQVRTVLLVGWVEGLGSDIAHTAAAAAAAAAVALEDSLIVEVVVVVGLRTVGVTAACLDRLAAEVRGSVAGSKETHRNDQTAAAGAVVCSDVCKWQLLFHHHWSCLSNLNHLRLLHRTHPRIH